MRKCTGIAVNVSETAHTRHEPYVGGTGSCLGSQEEMYALTMNGLILEQQERSTRGSA